MKQFKNTEVKAVFNAYPFTIKEKLMRVRQLIFECADKNEIISELEETLKWGQPSYGTTKTKSGTSIRLGFLKPAEYVIYVHCQTTLIGEFKEIYPEMKFDGNRAIIFDSYKTIPVSEIKHFIYLALTYQYRKKTGVSI